MSVFLIRTFAYVILPLLLAGAAIALDKSARSRERRIEVFLVYMFAIGAAAGIANWGGHIFAADQVAEAIGWEPGSPFQLEMGFANLSYGILAIIAMGRRDGFREATVIGATIMSLGATLVHLWDIAVSGNLAPGNTLQNITNLARPAILIFLLTASRRAERLPTSEVGTLAFARWQGTVVAVAGPIAAGVGIGMGVGLAFGQPLVGLILGLAAGAALGMLQRSKLEAGSHPAIGSPTSD
ncbi:MAG: DUF6790 family protein [Caldilineales bacterium]